MMAESSAALSLRESFGDRKLPDITRKITACVACRKQKIKCHMNGSKEPCRRCKARGLPCTVNKSLQMILENDAGWKEAIEQRMRQVEDTLRLGTNQRDDFTSLTPEATPNTNMDLANPEPTILNEKVETRSDVTLNLSCKLGSFPGSSIITLTFTEQEARSDYKPDLISCGIITLEAAEEYFSVYRKSMEPCIYQILAEDDCLANIRARSSLLTAAICTVGSLSTNSASHKKCYGAFIKEVSSRLFSRHNSFDDVRALCIGAFWLNKESSALVGLGNDLNLHRCITKMPHTKIECYERTRLFFLIYICDHHCSLIYGKPSMTREFRCLKSPKSFLQSKFCTPEDVKLISQVELWSVSSRAFDIFGADTESSITNERIAELESLSRCFDVCRSNAMSIDERPGNFFQQLFDLHIHCAKLSLFSHAFRGSSQRHSSSLSNHFQEMEKFERSALESALAVVRAVAWGEEVQNLLETIPSYFGTMIAFASISLIKAWGKEPMMCYLDKNEVCSALDRLVEVFQACSARLQPEHPLCSFAKSLKIAMDGSCCHVNGNPIDMGFMANDIDKSIFGFNGFGDGSMGLDCLDDHNSLFSYPGQFNTDFLDLQNL
ncbi:hypothetical protein N431DRAFT_490384 [Stipitochalara longipes BDJ]|nr:hypothetical protein N431DRAFT_490384 [Stipitochalara longipes BDJ]